MYTFYFREVAVKNMDCADRYKLIAIKGRHTPTSPELGEVFDCAAIETLVSNGFKCIIEPRPAAKEDVDALIDLDIFRSVGDTVEPTMRYAPGFRGPKSIHFADQECHITAQELRDQGCNIAPSLPGFSDALFGEHTACHTKFEPWKPEDGVIMGGIFNTPGTFIVPVPTPPDGTMLNGSVATSKEFPFPDNRQLVEEFLDRKLYRPPLNFWQKLLRVVGYIQE